MNKIYKAYRDGYITIGGQSVEVKVGQTGKESVARNYPNFFHEVAIEAPVEVAAVEEIAPPMEIVEEDVTVEAPIEELPIEDIVEEAPTTEPKKKRR